MRADDFVVQTLENWMFFVEDELAETILRLGMPHLLRQRVRITPIGSSGAVIRGMATRYLERKDNCLCVLDGDRRNSIKRDLSLFCGYTEGKFRDSKKEMRSWIKDRVIHLPTNEAPEVWLLDSCSRINDKCSLSETWCVNDQDVVGDWLDEALRQPAHRQFFSISRESQLSVERIVGDLVRFLLSCNPEILNEVMRYIGDRLDE